ncbi:MAG: hypothetical protein NTZ48_00045, partial [Candidatus Omnitrophica bacterium]|nr:hypothetical protein [Candidatus Omnitrophota bacterium]
MHKIFKLTKWLYPGMRIKRWIILCAIGIFCVGVGSVKMLSKEGAVATLSGSITLILGIFLLILGIRYMVKSFI